LKDSTNVKIAMQCFENFGGGKSPKCPPDCARLVSNNEHSMKMIIVAWAIHSLQGEWECSNGYEG